MAQQLSLRTRPRRFADLIGQEDVTEELVNYYVDNSDLPVALMFTGPSGVGKTSLARLCAVSLECPHSTEFGNPCKECYWASVDPEQYGFEEFTSDITEVNCADMPVDELRKLMAHAVYAPGNGARFRTYILDELQVLSKQSQKFLFKILEDSPESTKFYLCTTEPEDILEPVVNRCVTYQLRHLSEDGLNTLVSRLLVKSKSDLDPTVLANLLIENHVWSHRAVAQAVTKYLSGATPESAASYGGLEGLDIGLLCRYILGGDWGKLSLAIQALENSQFRLVRNNVALYLQSMLLSEQNSGEKRKKLANGITRLSQVNLKDSSMLRASVTAALHDVMLQFVRNA